MRKENLPLSRREFVKLGIASSAGLVLIACGSNSENPTTPLNESAQLQATPNCDDHDETIAQTAGPFYTPHTPERTNFIEAGITGIPLLVTGKVLTTDCQPIANAILDFWHADDAGNYDNDGFRLRGHQFTDENGNFQLETIVPGLYPGRTRHIHVRVQGEGTDLLTTQLYFPDEAANNGDGIFDEALLMDMLSDEEDGKTAVFNFVLA